MIDRLLELEVSGFRLFRGPVRIPFDADVVLIYGPNGSGKTSVVQALECALTGDVADLQMFEDDYPRCLRHHGAKQCRVGVRFQGIGSEHTQAFAVLPNGRIEADAPGLSPAEKEFYRDRCLLSQLNLGRLFELYQASDKSSEQPIVKFIRELLKLETFDQITNGLGFIGDVRNTRKEVRALRELEEEIEQCKHDRDSLRTKLQSTQTERAPVDLADEETLKQIAKLFPRGLPVTFDEAAFGPIRQTLEVEIQTAEEQLRELRKLQSEFEAAAAGLQAGSSAEDFQKLKDDLSKANAELDEHVSVLADYLADCLRERLLPMAPIETRSQQAAAVSQHWMDCNDWCQQRQKVLELDQRRFIENDERGKRLSQELKAIETELERFRGLDASLTANQSRARTLREVLDFVHDDRCPICQRDYSELDGGSLHERIAAEIRELDAQLAQFDVERERRKQLADQQQRLKCEVDELQQSLPQVQLARDSAERTLPKILSLLARSSSLQPNFQSWTQAVQQQRLLASKSHEFELLQDRMAQHRQRLEGLVKELSLPSEPATSEWRKLADAVKDAVSARLTASEQQRSLARGVLETLASAHANWRTRRNEGDQLAKTEHRFKKLQTAREQVTDLIAVAKELVKQTNQVKSEVLKEVFNDSLNALWSDLFQRLVKGEPFQLRLGDLKPVRGKLKVEFQASFKTDIFGQPGSVLSSGNLNTAALSLFLALHLIESPVHKVLVLDDPVQNMDDMHVVQLAEVLRAIMWQEGRQLVIAVHERPLFDYLCLELAPTREGQSLMAIELTRDPRTFETTVQSERRTWKPDNLRFESA